MGRRHLAGARVALNCPAGQVRLLDHTNRLIGGAELSGKSTCAGAVEPARLQASIIVVSGRRCRGRATISLLHKTRLARRQIWRARRDSCKCRRHPRRRRRRRRRRPSRNLRPIQSPTVLAVKWSGRAPKWNGIELLAQFLSALSFASSGESRDQTRIYLSDVVKRKSFSRSG